ncbi:protein kinase domain containing protein [Acanthamoeba castellanii str. Neff]|uniref:Protein kinase domain containing protein n=1 Tax=Acanthamoeba castellanii (strain ATCC 30010 / Neff) TaxID=1257118 RepID=L8GZ58_ACACF|nr:protein kinase domain containing protein [Acanthamoeba castellanii str. Neff]ELR18280.1 protein kinase domain containing protein [Acanthamoeba castellanii str. Neff]
MTWWMEVIGCLCRFNRYTFSLENFLAGEYIYNTLAAAGDAGVARTLAATPYGIGFDAMSIVAESRTLPVGDIIQGGVRISATRSSIVETARLDLAKRATTGWPIVYWSHIYVPPSCDYGCPNLATFLEWVYWRQTNTLDVTARLSDSEGAGQVSPDLATSLALSFRRVTCGGPTRTAFARSECMDDAGTTCSNHGTCVVPSALHHRERDCASAVKPTSAAASTNGDSELRLGLGLGLGIGIGVGVVLLLLFAFVCVLAALGVGIVRRKRERPAWDASISDIEFGDLIGTGGNGDIHKAKWRGTEVAVKTFAAHRTHFSRDELQKLRGEVDIMNSMRHPNYLLALRVKLALGIAKGMHYIHSQGIVHRDLKSPNVLIDSKWNAEVADFGLSTARHAAGLSIPWAAPEILSDSTTADGVLADIYSFGIILWEIITREKPYNGMSPAAIAVAKRPVFDDDVVPLPYLNAQDLVYEKEDVVERPTLPEIINALDIVAGACAPEKRVDDSGDNSGSMTRGSSSGSNASSMRSIYGNVRPTAHGYGTTQPPPHDGDVYVVISDISGADRLWELYHSAACEATMIHNVLMRDLMATHNGYEVHMSGLKASMGAGTFCVAFRQAIGAVAWCSSAQRALVVADWPAGLLRINGAHAEYGNSSDEHFVYRGLRVRMGVHVGPVRRIMDPKTRRVEYIGSQAIAHVSSGGQVLVSPDVKAELTDLPDEIGRMRPLRIQHMGNIDLEQAAPEGIAYQLIVNSLEMRAKNHVRFNDDCDVLQLPAEDMSLLVAGGLLTREIETGKVIGRGTSAVVYRGLWSKSTPVAVKIFNRSKMTEEQALRFRVEVATLAELSHPNVLLFIGATIGDKHLSLVVAPPCGSLAGVLANASEFPLTFTQRMHMAYGAARAAIAVAVIRDQKRPVFDDDVVPSPYLNSQDLVYEKEVTEMQDLTRRCWAQDVVERPTLPEIINALDIVAGACAPEKRVDDSGDNSGSMTRGSSGSNASSMRSIYGNVRPTAHGRSAVGALPLGGVRAAGLLRINGAHAEYGNSSDEHFVYRGLRVRTGVHVGPVRRIMDPKTRRVEYIGPAVKGAMAIAHVSSGGQVLVSPDVKAELTDLPDEIGRMRPLRIQHMGNIDLEQAAPEGIAYQLIVNSLEMRAKNHVRFNEDDDDDDCDVLQLPAEDMSLLVSANKCRWFIDPREIETGKVIGRGTSAVVYRGLWSKSTPVAVKIFNRSKMTEEQALRFRVEVATLAELSHPNVLLFIGATIGDKHLSLVTEFVPCGSLAGVLAYASEFPLTFTQRMHMAYGAARGVRYLHSLDPPLLHRDLKSSNLLVDDCTIAIVL